MQIDTTGRFYSQNKQARIRVTKSAKNLTITTKQVVVAKIMYARMPKHNKKQNMTRNNCARRGSDTETNVQTANTHKSEELGPKIRQAVHESTAKNKATTELHMQ